MILFFRKLKLQSERKEGINMNDFLTFADFFFDGFVMDVIVQSKISNAKRQCDDAIRQVETIREKLVMMERS